MATPQKMLGAMLRIPFRAIVDNICVTLIAAGYTDLRPTHFVVFQNMRPEGVRGSELAEEAQITKQSMSNLISYLEECGYVEKVVDPLDGRAQLVRLTKKGEEVERIAREAIASLQSEWSKIVGEVQMQELLLTLERLVDFIEGGDH